MENKEFDYRGLSMNGFVAIPFAIVLLIIAVGLFFTGMLNGAFTNNIISVVLFFLAVFMMKGYVMQEPNEARVLTFFGRYVGTFRKTGFYWVNPLMSGKKVSLRARNLNAEPIKVNDQDGNPILIGQVLVWKLKDTYKALFEIDSQTMGGGSLATAGSRMMAFENFVRVQSDAALRQVAGMYPYDINNNDENETTLRGGGEAVNDVLLQKLNERLSMAGLEVVEARINYLAYAPEIAAVMLRRQQATAIIAAREKIVEGAVSMVKLALDKLSDENVVTLTDDKKARMVSNLLVVLCADEQAQPVVNTGSIE